MTTNMTAGKNHSLTAMQTGWLVVETFGRLARFTKASRKSTRRKGDKSRPFAFSVNESRSLDELIGCVNFLYNICDSLALEGLPSLPIPRGQELIKKLEGDGFDLDTLQGELEAWSNIIWGLLNSNLGLAAHAFFFGGALANTFWHTVLVWSDDKSLAEYLNFHRLDYLATQLEFISGNLPDYVADAIAASLRKWSNLDLASTDLSRLKDRLEAQQEVWRDLLLEKRHPEGYLREKHRRGIRSTSLGAQMLFVVIILLAVSAVGREVGSLFPSDSSSNLSGFFAALSGFIVVLGGLVTQFSAWTKNIGAVVAEWEKRRLILRNTFRDWREPTKKQGDRI